MMRVAASSAWISGPRQATTLAARSTIAGARWSQAAICSTQASLTANLERQRDRLLQDDEALAEFLAAHPDCDVQNLRQLIRNARKEQAESKPPKAYRQLFQLLKSLSPAPGLPQHATASDSDEDNEDNG